VLRFANEHFDKKLDLIARLPRMFAWTELMMLFGIFFMNFGIDNL